MSDPSQASSAKEYPQMEDVVEKAYQHSWAEEYFQTDDLDDNTYQTSWEYLQTEDQVENTCEDGGYQPEEDSPVRVAAGVPDDREFQGDEVSS
jgi:hypothetical protein